MPGASFGFVGPTIIIPTFNQQSPLSGMVSQMKAVNHPAVMKPLFIAIIAFIFSLNTLPAAETVYRPAGTNTATVAAPRDDWYADVQRKFDRYSGKHFDIVFDGDSIMNRWETTGREIWTQRFAGRAADFGIEGDRVENVLWRLSKGQVDGMDPKVVVLMIGTNNSGRNSADEIAQGIERLVAEYENRCPHAHIILFGIFPRGKTSTDGGRRKVADVNEKIKRLDDGKRVSYIDLSSKMIEPDGSISPDMMPDFVHPTLRGYQLWAEALQPMIERFSK